MERRLLAVLLVVVIALGGLAAFLLLRDGNEETDPALAAFSTRGRPIQIAVPERYGAPNSPKFTGEALLIGERDGIRFLRLPRVDGSSCWTTSERRFDEWQLTNYGCEFGFVRFPDPKRPLMIAARIQGVPGTQLINYESFAGFAADAVKRVAVIDENERLRPVADVVGNVFYAPKPPTRAKAVAALDEAGEVIWRGGEVQSPVE